MKILVIFTGGTIGSTIGENYISLDDAKKYALIENFKNTCDTKVDFDIETPYTIFSENLSGSELTTLCKLVESKVNAGYDGIIVTHGTDTLQYTASALAFTIKTEIPILLVSSNYPLGERLANGYDNFFGAVKFIEKHKEAGVFVSYRPHSPDDVFFYLPTRLTTHSEAKDILYSIDYFPYGYYVKKRDKAFYMDEVDIVDLMGGTPKIKGSGAIGAVEFLSDPKILYIQSHPADNFSYNIDGYNAVLIKPYHSGTIDTANEKFIEFCNKAKKQKLPIFIANVHSGVPYESTKCFKDLGLTVLPYSAIPAMYIKLWLAISINADIKKFMKKELMGEFPKVKE